MEQFTGKVWILGDDIDTDIIIPTEYLALPTVEDMKQYGFSPLRPELAGQIQEGDIIVAGKNFGCGSSREQAPEIIKALKIKCVIAKSYARIFFRNSINNGLLLIENSDIQDVIKEGDTLTVHMGESLEFDGKTINYWNEYCDNDVKSVSENNIVIAKHSITYDVTKVSDTISEKVKDGEGGGYSICD